MLAGSGRGMRAFLVRAGGNLYLEGFELRGWSAATGGAIRLDGGGKATLVDCTLEGNSASAGGATLNGAAPDSSTSFGGAPWSLASAGGAVFVADGAVLEARDVEFVSNFAGEDGAGTPEGFGGAVAVLGSGSVLRCEGCSFVKNVAGGAGGAVAAAAGGAIALSGPSGAPCFPPTSLLFSPSPSSVLSGNLYLPCPPPPPLSSSSSCLRLIQMLTLSVDW